MKIVVIGYGRVGSRTVQALVERGHQISLIDKDGTRLSQAAQLEGVELFQGNGIDVDVQREAGMGEADLLLAVTRDDNVNIMSAQVARSHFHVPRAIARIYEPSHAEALSDDPHLTIVCPTLSAVEMVVNEVDAGPAARAEEGHLQGAKGRPPDSRDESRYILVAGGGKVGINLARALFETGHEVAIIENDAARAAALANKLDCPIYIGDASTHETLEQAGAGRARVFVAATGSDQDNLVACQVAKRVFGIPTAVARASNPKNEEVMARLGVDSTVSSTAIIQQVIERELPTVRIKTLLSLREGALQILEYPLDATSPASGKFVRDVKLPPESNLIAIIRGNSTLVPRGETELQEGDTIVALVNSDQESSLREALLGV